MTDGACLLCGTDWIFKCNSNWLVALEQAFPRSLSRVSTFPLMLLAYRHLSRLLSEGQAAGAWEPSNKTPLYHVSTAQQACQLPPLYHVSRSTKQHSRPANCHIVFRLWNPQVMLVLWCSGMWGRDQEFDWSFFTEHADRFCGSTSCDVILPSLPFRFH